jgi:hypothetical protein
MSEYLSRPSEFENAINRGGLSFRSSALTQLVSAVNQYVTNRFADGSEASKYQVREVASRFYAWKIGDPKEFARRGAPLEAGFCDELANAFEAAGLIGDPDDPPNVQMVEERFPPPPAVARNRWRDYKRAGKLGLTGVSAGVSLAQTATHTGALAAATGAAVGATGIGLFAVAGAVQVGTTVLASRAAYKTYHHIKGLQELYDSRDRFSGAGHCGQIVGDSLQQNGWSHVSHDMVANHVLPYIIRKKTSKMYRKVVTAVPVIGVAESARAVGQKAIKKLRGTLGANRLAAAEWLACHFLECDCQLTQAIVAELYSVGEMEALKGTDSYQEVAQYLALKMKST